MLKFFDCDIGVGGSGLRLPVFRKPRELLAAMDHYSIEKALVYDRGALESGAFGRMDFISGFTACSDRLVPAIDVAPPATGEQPPPDELLDIMRQNGIKAARISPNIHNLDFDTFSMGKLLERFEKRRIPVIYNSMFLDRLDSWSHVPNWREIRETALAFPALPIIVVFTGMLQGRRLFPLLETCPNVLADLTCHSFQYIEYIVEHMGSQRLVMASHLPWEDPGLYTTWIHYAGISCEAREDIAYNNLNRLLGESK